jgi:hypothetical protein
MTIWLFLDGCCLLGPLFLAVDLARAAHAGVLGFALSLLCATLIGLSSTAIMWWAPSEHRFAFRAPLSLAAECHSPRSYRHGGYLGGTYLRAYIVDPNCANATLSLRIPLPTKSYSALFAFVALLIAGSAHADVGCLADVPSLLPKATIILAGRIDNVRKVRISTCDATDPNMKASKPLECGQGYELKISVAEHLLGETSRRVDVLVPNLLVNLSCDDRPPVEKMKGLYAVLFLEATGGYLWTVDGPNSIYTFSHEVDPQFLQAVKKTLAGYYSVDGKVASASSTARGTLIDPSGARVPETSLTFEDREHHKFETLTAKDGTYSISLEPGPYTVEASHVGFCVMRRGEFYLEKGATADFDFDLVLCSTDSSRKPYEVEELQPLDSSGRKPRIEYGFRKGDNATEYVGLFQQGHYIRPVFSYDVWTLRADSLIVDRLSRTITAEGHVLWQNGETSQTAQYVRILLENPPQLLKIEP